MISPKFIMMVGLSASGKSSLTKELSRINDATIHSSDQLRVELCGDQTDQTKNQEVFQELFKRIKNDLSENKNAIMDCTNINIKSRKGILEHIKKINCYKIAYLTNKSVEACIDDNIYRDLPVPHYVIQRQQSNYQIPFLEEGFDEIVIQNENKFDIDSIQYKMKDFDQKTKWHKYDLLTHCNKCYEELLKNTDNNNLLIAGRIHDYGKLYTQTFGEDGNGHYYQHHNIGAYKLLTELNLTKDDLIEVLFYVNYHMNPFFWENPKTHLKYKRLFGDEKYDNLILFNKCDKIASGTEE